MIIDERKATVLKYTEDLLTLKQQGKERIFINRKIKDNDVHSLDYHSQVEYKSWKLK